MPPRNRARRVSLSAIAGSVIIAVGGGPLSDGPLRALATAGPSPAGDPRPPVTEVSSTTAPAPATGTGPQEAGAKSAGAGEGDTAVKEGSANPSAVTPTKTSATSSATSSTTTAAATPTTTPATTPTTTSTTPTTTPTTTSTTPTTTPTTTSTTPTTTPTTTSTTPTTTATASPPPPPSAPASTPAGSPAPVSAEAPVVVRQRPQEITGGERVTPRIATTHCQPSTAGATGATGDSGSAEQNLTSATPPTPSAVSAPPSAGSLPANNNVAPPPQLAAGQAGALAAELASSAASVQALSFYRIPLFLLPIYEAAAVQYGVPWQILAAINEIETNYGSDLSVSTAGAVGWMQFMPATWSSYGVDAFQAGYADPYNPVDAIYAAARYLRAAGAGKDLRGAILAYNHSNEYADSVLLRAKLISTYPQSVIQTLTGLVDDRPPATGGPIAWDPLRSSAGATSATGVTSPAGTTSPAPAPAPVKANAQSASEPSSPTAAQATTPATQAKPSTPGSEAPPAPTTASAIATGKLTTSAKSLKLIDLLSAPHAAVVAVQDGRIVKLGASRKLGRYVILRDLYGDEFTYAGLGSIAQSYRSPTPPHPPPPAAAARAAGAQGPAPATPASAGRQLPQTLTATTPSASAEENEALLSAGSVEATPAGMGKVRLFAHPHNPDALAAAHSAAQAARAQKQAEGASGLLPLRSGSLVAEGTVLGHVNLPPRAKDGHLQFAIRPAGDALSIDPAPILKNWVELRAALHPRGAKTGESLIGASASEAFLISKSRLQSEILSDPGITLSGCSREVLASGQIDQRVLALIAFLSRSGLKPTLAALRCGGGRYDISGYVPADHLGDAIAITHINGTAVAHNQGQGSITDTTIRTLLSVPARFAPRQIVSLMHYPADPSTLARSDHGSYIEIVFDPATPKSAKAALAAKAAHSAPTGPSAPSPQSVGGELSAAQWEQLVARVGALPAPTVSTTPSSSAIPDASGG
jgi:hypothetical protein